VKTGDSRQRNDLGPLDVLLRRKRRNSPEARPASNNTTTFYAPNGNYQDSVTFALSVWLSGHPALAQAVMALSGATVGSLQVTCSRLGIFAEYPLLCRY